MIGLLWTTAYSLTAQINPRAFVFNTPGQTMDAFNAFYFSFVTLSRLYAKPREVIALQVLAQGKEWEPSGMR